MPSTALTHLLAPEQIDEVYHSEELVGPQSKAGEVCFWAIWIESIALKYDGEPMISPPPCRCMYIGSQKRHGFESTAMLIVDARVCSRRGCCGTLLAGCVVGLLLQSWCKSGTLRNDWSTGNYTSFPTLRQSGSARHASHTYSTNVCALPG